VFDKTGKFATENGIGLVIIADKKDLTESPASSWV